MKIHVSLRLVILFALVSLANLSNAQIRFEPAYFIDENGKRVDCLIKDVDWKNNPEEFTYKLSEEGETYKKNVDDVLIFGIETEEKKAKYVSALVNIDRSSDVESKLSFNRLPEWQKEKLFLKVLMEGEASLFYYEDKNLRRFFFNTSKNDSIQQLVYKRYRPEATVAKTNNTFRQQLMTFVNCVSTSKAKIEKLRYTDSQLKDYFRDYNEACVGNFLEYGNKVKGKLFSMKVTAGIHYATLQLNRSINLKGSPSIRFGTEFEMILPFQNDKLRFFSDPSFHYFKSTLDVNNIDITYDYHFIELPLGLRYYLYLSEKSKVFLTSTYVYEVLMFENVQKIGSGTWTGGIGFEFDRISFETRYFAPTTIDFFISSDYNRTLFNIGYRIF